MTQLMPRIVMLGPLSEYDETAGWKVIMCRAVQYFESIPEEDRSGALIVYRLNDSGGDGCGRYSTGRLSLHAGQAHPTMPR